MLQLTPKCKIESLTDKNKKKFEFAIIGSDNRQSNEYILSASNADERQSWIDILNATISLNTSNSNMTTTNPMSPKTPVRDLQENRVSQVTISFFLDVFWFFFGMSRDIWGKDG